MRTEQVARLLGGAGAAAGTLAAAYGILAAPRSQLLGPFPYRLPTQDKVVALTFDDGPNEPYTSRLADLLAQRQARATFFQVGRCVQRFPETTRRLARDGHVIGNHSWSHSVPRCLAPGAMATETLRTSALLSDVLGHAPTFYRPPWLLRTPAHWRTWAAAGLRPVSGLFAHPLEVFQPAATVIAEHAVRLVRPGTILIFHDGYNARGADRSQTVTAVGFVIDRLRARGYSFAGVDELL